MDKELHFSPEIVEKALRGAIMEQLSKDPDYLRRLLDELEEDAAMLKLLKETEKTDNPSVSSDAIWSILNGK